MGWLKHKFLETRSNERHKSQAAIHLPFRPSLGTPLESVLLLISHLENTTFTPSPLFLPYPYRLFTPPNPHYLYIPLFHPTACSFSVSSTSHSSPFTSHLPLHCSVPLFFIPIPSISILPFHFVSTLPFNSFMYPNSHSTVPSPRLQHST